MDSKNVNNIIQNYKKFSTILFERLINLENEIHREDNELYKFYEEKNYTVRPLIDAGDVVPREDIIQNFSNMQNKEELATGLNNTDVIEDVSKYVDNFLKKYIERKEE